MKRFTLVLAASLTIMLFIGPAACEKKGPYADDKKGPTTAAGEINWSGYDDGMKKAQAAGKPVMIDFYTTWCKWCKTLDETTYKDKDVINILNNDFVAIKVNAESTNKVNYDGKQITEAELARAFQVSGFPTIWLLDNTGKKIAPLPGYNPPEEFKPVLTFVSSGAYAKGVKYDEYLKTLKK